MRAIAALFFVAACASTPHPIEPGPRGLRASDHLAIAHDEDRADRESKSFPDTRDVGPTDAPVGVWTRSWDTTDHARLAAIHRSRATAIEDEFSEACAGFSDSEMSVSPLAQYGIGGWNTTTGVIIYLSTEAGNPELLLRRMRCHRAWMMLGRSDMENCPLDLPAIAVDARGDLNGVTISIIARDPNTIVELQRRAALEIESAQKHVMN
ncbi:MAG TPA: hypothetical protein VGM90_01530 [Kofleriaceae bacterium]|jgi:hypothetical protein